MTTEIWRVHILWIFQITKITRAKSPIQNGLSGGFQERVGIKNKSERPLRYKGISLFLYVLATKLQPIVICSSCNCILFS